jgi:transposase
MGKSRGGLSTKIHATVDALGKPVRLLLTSGETSEFTQAEALINGFEANYVLEIKVMIPMPLLPRLSPNKHGLLFRRRHRKAPRDAIRHCIKSTFWWNAAF